MSKFNIIGLHGKMGSGKDFLNDNVIKPQLNEYDEKYSIISFADQIKINVATQHNMNIMDMYGDKSPELRILLQEEGTERGRDKYGEDIWIKYVENWMILRHQRDNVGTFLITDVRFKNEAEWIVKMGGKLIKIHAPDRNEIRLTKESGGDPKLLEKIQNHPSETDLDDYEFENVIDNSIKNQDKSTGELRELIV